MAKAKDKSSLIKDISKRYKLTAREARDVFTSVGTFIKTINETKPDPRGLTPTVASRNANRAAASDVKKQVKEVISAAKSGKTGTTAAQSKAKRTVVPGVKRK